MTTYKGRIFPHADGTEAGYQQTDEEVELLAAVARDIGDAIVVHGPDGAIRMWNKGAERLFGCTRQTALKRRITGFIAAADRPGYQDHVARLSQHAEHTALEIRGVTEAGDHPCLLLSSSLLVGADGQSAGIVAMFRDISAQKDIEHKLVALIESTPDPFIIIEADGSIQRVNRQAEILFGYPRQELIGKSFKMLVPDRFRAEHDLHTRNYYVKPVMRQMGSGLELSCLTRTGEEIPVEIGLSPVVAEHETTVMVRFRDIREQKREQAQLLQARQRADEDNRAKSRFLAAASHDLRQPLQSISMNLGVLAGNIGSAEKERVIAHTRMALDTTNKLLNSLLNITKLESGIVQPEIAAFHINQVLERVYNIERQQAQQKQQTFSLRSSSLAVSSDPALLEQLLTNLVANAIRYTPKGGHILLGCRRLGDSIRIEVIDNGPGIAAEALDQIFDEYHQLEPSRHYEGVGLGLGLSIVKLLAELLHLKLEVKSVTGSGSCFGVIVPLARDVPQSHHEPLEHKAPLQQLTGTVLIIDDDEAVLDSTGLFLGMSGFRVLLAHNSAEALALLDDARPDLVISDYGLAQQETGIDLLKRIRQILQKNVPAIIITGDTSLQRQGNVTGNTEIVSKPVDPQTLLQLVHKYF